MFYELPSGISGRFWQVRLSDGSIMDIAAYKESV